jgi:hypothetical protein
MMKMKKLSAIALIGVLALSLTGCGWQGTGTIVEKTHRDRWMSLTLVGKVLVPITHPESWGFKVKDTEEKTHEVSVKKEEWIASNVGDSFTTKGE